jgi:hypothetical protein
MGEVSRISESKGLQMQMVFKRKGLQMQMVCKSKWFAKANGLQKQMDLR